jgi:hypothetical protein
MYMSVVYVVTGRVRSGTSMMMRASVVGGMNAAYKDFRIPSRNSEYNPNPYGYYEGGLQEGVWPADFYNKLIKTFAVYFDDLDHTGVELKAVFLKRDDDEIKASFKHSFKIDVNAAAEFIDLELALEQIRSYDQVDLIVVDYLEMVLDPIGQCQRLADWGWPINVEAAAETIDASLYRHRKIEGQVVYRG